MAKKYVGVWGVFEEDFAEGLETAFRRYEEAGITHVMYGGIAHTFDVNDQYYQNTAIDPWVQINYEKNVGDVFGTKFNLITSEFNELNALAGKYGLSLDFDITPGVSDPIVEAYPDTAVVDIEGKRSKHWMCPNNPDVRNYFFGRTEDILRNYRGIREVELDVVSIDFYDPQVVPDWVLPELYPMRQLAIGNCFCDHCVAAAKDAGLDVGRIKTEIGTLYKEATKLTYDNFKNFADSYRGLFDVMRFVIKHPELMQWLTFRGASVDGFVSGINRLVKSIDPQILLSSDLVSPSFSWTLGQFYHTQPGITDLTKLMLYHKRIGSFEIKPLKRIQQAVPEISEQELLDQYFRLKAFTGPDSFQGFEEEGVGVENVYYEVKKAKLEVGRNHKIIAGLVGDPPATMEDVREAVRMAHKGGADGYMLHLWYGNSPRENIVAFGDELRKLGEI